MYIVTTGVGILRTEKKERHIKTGDVIVMPPSKHFAIESVENLTYIYASYLGTRAGILAETYKIEPYGSIFEGYQRLIPMWLNMVSKKMKNASICCEGVILYTFSEISEAEESDDGAHSPDNAAHKIRDFIDKHFTNHELKLEKIASALNYNPKYVSSAFIREFKINVNKYIRTLRIQHACTLMDQGLSSVKDISSLSGYTDPLYFSTVFKEEMAYSPKEYINIIKKAKKNSL